MSAATPRFADLSVGDVVAEHALTVTRDSLVRYAGASGDFNPIHYRDDLAQSVGLPGVLAHGMLTMGLAVQPVVAWLGGDSGRVVDYQVRFTRPVLVDADTGAELQITAKVGALEPAAAADAAAAAPHDPSGGVARIDLTVAFDGGTVLGKAQVRVRLA